MNLYWRLPWVPVYTVFIDQALPLSFRYSWIIVSVLNYQWARIPLGVVSLLKCSTSAKTKLAFTATRGSNGPKLFQKRLALLYYRYLNTKTSFCSSTNHFPFITYGYKSWDNNIWFLTIVICNPNFLGSEIPSWVSWTCIPNKEAQLLCMLPDPKDTRMAGKRVKKKRLALRHSWV